MEDSLVLRIAGVQDIKFLAGLYAEFHNFHARYIPDRLICVQEKPDVREGNDLYRRLKKIIQNKNSAIILAETDQGPIGFAEIYILQDEPSPHTVAYQYGFLQSLAVINGHRRQGIGTRLVNAIEQWAKEKDAHEVRLELWEFEEGPLPFYELMDYRTLKRTMIHQIDGENHG